MKHKAVAITQLEIPFQTNIFPSHWSVSHLNWTYSSINHWTLRVVGNQSWIVKRLINQLQQSAASLRTKINAGQYSRIATNWFFFLKIRDWLGFIRTGCWIAEAVGNRGWRANGKFTVKQLTKMRALVFRYKCLEARTNRMKLVVIGSTGENNKACHRRGFDVKVKLLVTRNNWPICPRFVIRDKVDATCLNLAKTAPWKYHSSFRGTW